MALAVGQQQTKLANMSQGEEVQSKELTRVALLSLVVSSLWRE